MLPDDVVIEVNYRPSYADYLVSMEAGSPVFIKRDHAGNSERGRDYKCSFTSSGRLLQYGIERRLRHARKRFAKITALHKHNQMRQNRTLHCVN